MSVQRNFGIDEHRLDLIGRGEHGDVARVVVAVVVIVVVLIDHSWKVIEFWKRHKNAFYHQV